VEPEMYYYTSNNCSHWNINKRFKRKFGRRTRQKFSRLTTKDSCTRNITHNIGSAAVCNWKPERLVGGEKCQGEKACVKRHIIIIYAVSIAKGISLI
jgi:hypothetical protein